VYEVVSPDVDPRQFGTPDVRVGLPTTVVMGEGLEVPAASVIAGTEAGYRVQLFGPGHALEVLVLHEAQTCDASVRSIFARVGLDGPVHDP
jgi:hypothetical protein